MTVEEFDGVGQYDKPCQKCRRVGMARELNEHNQMRVICSHCGSKTPWGSFNLKQGSRTIRKAYPMGEELDEVWARFDNLCFACGRTKDECLEQRVGRHRHHVAEYAKTVHQGPIVPICGLCHPVVTSLQKMRALVQWSRTHAELTVGSRPDLPGDGLSPDPVRAAGETPVGAVERLSDDDADD